MSHRQSPQAATDRPDGATTDTPRTPSADDFSPGAALARVLAAATRVPTVGGVNLAQLAGTATDVVNTARTNRGMLPDLVRLEVERVVGALGLVTPTDVMALRKRVSELERRVARLDSDLDNVVAATPGARRRASAPGAPLIAADEPHHEGATHADDQSLGEQPLMDDEVSEALRAKAPVAEASPHAWDVLRGKTRAATSNEPTSRTARANAATRSDVTPDMVTDHPAHDALHEHEDES